MTQLFDGHVDNPPVGEASDFAAVLDNVKSYIETEEIKRGCASANSFPVLEINRLLLERWGHTLYPEGHDVIPYIDFGDRWVLTRRMSARYWFGSAATPARPAIPPTNLNALVDELACEIMGWHITHGSNRIICPHVPIRPATVTDPNTFEPVTVFRTTFGWLDNRKDQ